MTRRTVDELTREKDAALSAIASLKINGEKITIPKIAKISGVSQRNLYNNPVCQEFKRTKLDNGLGKPVLSTKVPNKHYHLLLDNDFDIKITTSIKNGRGIGYIHLSKNGVHVERIEFNSNGRPSNRITELMPYTREDTNLGKALIECCNIAKI